MNPISTSGATEADVGSEAEAGVGGAVTGTEAGNGGDAEVEGLQPDRPRGQATGDVDRARAQGDHAAAGAGHV